MTKQEVVKRILEGRGGAPRGEARAFAPVNIALCKYWGKRNEELNLPVTSSLSVSLGEKGTHTELKAADDHDRLTIDGKGFAADSPVSARLFEYLDLFRGAGGTHFDVSTESNVPMGAGLASSAAVFASLVKALDGFFDWGLDERSLSILARMGSGSAARSLYEGFVEWHVGIADDGMDSFAEPLEATWPDLRLGLLVVSADEKPIGSREAMQRTVTTCELYEMWPVKVANDLVRLKQAIRDRDFKRLGEAAESNALTMHATMMATWPPVLYWRPESVDAIRRVWSLREQGLQLYLTMDAGPNVKLLFRAEDTEEVQTAFANVEVVAPFQAHR